jgi:hypothetical protein
MDKYVTKPEVVEAIKYQSTTVLAKGQMEDSFGVCYGYCLNRAHIHTGAGMVPINVGDYIVIANNDRYVYSPSDFEKKFERHIENEPTT